MEYQKPSNESKKDPALTVRILTKGPRFTTTTYKQRIGHSHVAPWLSDQSLLNSCEPRLVNSECFLLMSLTLWLLQTSIPFQQNSVSSAPKFLAIDFLMLCVHGRGQNLHLCFSFMAQSLFLCSTDLDFLLVFNRTNVVL